MSTLSTVSVDFVARTIEFTEGLEKIKNSTIKFSAGFHKDMAGVKEDLLGLSKIGVTAFLGLAGAITAGVGESVASLAKLSEEATKLGMSVEAYQALSKAAGDVGTDMGAMVGAINRVQKALDAASQGGEAQILAFNKIGLSVEKLRQLAPEQRFAAISDALNAMTNENDKASASLAIFGKGVAEMKPLLALGSEGLAKAAEEGANMGVVLSKEAVKGVKDFQVAVHDMKETVEGQFNILAAALAPMAKKFVDELTPSAKEAGAAFDNLNKILDYVETPLYMIALGIDVLITAFYGFRAAIYGLASMWFKSFEMLLDGFNAYVRGTQTGINYIIAAWNKLPFTKKIEPVVFGEFFSGAKAMLKDFGDFSAQQMAKDSAAASNAWTNGFSQKFEGAIGNLRANINQLKTDAIEAGKNVAKSLTSTDATGDNVGLGAGDGTELWIDGMIQGYKNMMEEAQRYYNYWLAEEKLAQKYRSNAETDNAEILKIQRLHNEGILMGVDYTKALSDAQTKMWEHNNPLAAQALQLFSGIGDSMANAIVQGNGLRDVFKNMMQSIMALIVKYIILTALAAMLGMVDIAAGTTLMKSFSAMSGLNSMNGIKGKAKGGPISGNTPYMVGEQGPELFVPSNSGYIVPNDKMSGTSGGVVNQTINISTGVAQTVRAEMMQFMPAFKAQTMSGIIDASRRGGQFPKAVRGA